MREMNTQTQSETPWVNDDELGVAVREVGDELHVKPLSVNGALRIQEAGNRAYRTNARVRFPSDDYIAIDPAHRLAFARTLGQSFTPLGNAWSPEAFAIVRGAGNYWAESAVTQ
jgi:hypothetical protein